ncbi:MAG: hypothetical protein A2Y61_06345 [Chloroflexi bacterium RBG_13_60_13]|nr:MAG: hypothetical protein A2Y61_06345 [Chloroflexi bacterium RBG_13_60_13]
MSIRLRLALWYAGLTSVVVVVVVILAYVVHDRTQYQEVDRSLVNAAEHFSQELGNGATGQPLTLSGADVLIRLYGPDGQVLKTSPAVPALPPLDALQTLREHAGPAYDRILRWLPGGEHFAAGAFATARDSSTGNRVRLYTLPVSGSQGTVGYVQTWSSLASIDRSMRIFRFLMLGLGAGGVLAVWLGSLLVAREALRPIATMISSARAIASSRSFAHRLPEPQRTDELGRLARTFNEMLQSLEEAHRMQQRFIADAAHELRAPLTAIRGNIELLNRIPDMSAEERAESIASLGDEGSRLSRLVNELLTLARADAGQVLARRPLELDRILLDVLVEMRPLAARHDLQLEHFEPAVVQGDADRLKQFLLNLLDNSIKYTPAGGKISVRLDRTASEVALSIRDTGVGIASEDIPHVFDRFYRADPARGRDPGGSGLGLSIVKWIVEQHEGRIAFESELGKGTKVTVYLPVADSDTDAASSSPGQAGSAFSA